MILPGQPSGRQGIHIETLSLREDGGILVSGKTEYIPVFREDGRIVVVKNR
jgi:hypothetical protein